MTPVANTPVKTEKTAIIPAEIQKGIENHKKIASNLQMAAEQHLEAAKQHEAGEHDKAALSTVKASGYLTLASEGRREDAKSHVLKN